MAMSQRFNKNLRDELLSQVPQFTLIFSLVIAALMAVMIFLTDRNSEQSLGSSVRHRVGV